MLHPKTDVRRKAGTTSEYLTLLVIFFLLANTILGFLLAHQSSSALIALIQSRMLDISNTASAMLDGDILETVTPADRGTAGYEAIMRTLTYFQDNIELEYIYCIQDAGNKHFTFGLDPTVEDPGEFGSPVVYTDALYKASQGTPAVDDTAYEDEWGCFYSAYSPVFNSSGRVAGIVAVDFSKTWYDAQISTFMRTTLIISFLSLLIGGGLVLALTSKNRRSIRSVHMQLNDLADNLETFMYEIGNHTAVSEPRKAEQQELSRNTREDIDSLGKRILLMQKELHAQIAEVHEQAYIDSLTGVSNKAAYMNAMKQIDAMIAEGIAVFSVMVFDMNGLKAINDKYGHEMGDQALVELANVLISIYGRKSVFRIGGDEFISIIKTLSEEEIRFHFAQLDDALAAENEKERPCPFTLSLAKGYAVYTAETDKGYWDVFRRADQEMYRDKAAYYTKYADRRRKQEPGPWKYSDPLQPDKTDAVSGS